MATFVRLAQLPAKEIFGGAIRGHYAHLERSTIGEVHLAADTILPVHQHPHEQFTYVLEGRLEFRVGNECTLLEPGMVAIIPANIPHGGRALVASRVLDVFAPVREDYRT